MSNIEFERTDSAVLISTQEYQAVFAHCRAVLVALNGSIKQEDANTGVLEAAWRYGVNPFGLRGTLLFRALDDGAISITVKSGFKDSFNTTSAVEKKTQEIMNALLKQQSVDLNRSVNLGNLPPSIHAAPVNASRNKTKLAMALLSFLLGGMGVHKFYAGTWGWGLVYLASCFILPGISAVVAVVEFIRVLTLSPEAFDAKYNQAEPKPFTFIW